MSWVQIPPEVAHITSALGFVLVFLASKVYMYMYLSRISLFYVQKQMAAHRAEAEEQEEELRMLRQQSDLLRKLLEQQKQVQPAIQPVTR